MNKLNKEVGWEKMKEGYEVNPMWKGLADLLFEVEFDFHSGRDIEKLKDVIRDLLSQQREEILKDFVPKLRGDLIDFKGDWEELQDIIGTRLNKELKH